MASTSRNFASAFRRDHREPDDVIRIRKNHERRTARLAEKFGPEVSRRCAERCKRLAEENEMMLGAYAKEIQEKECKKKMRMAACRLEEDEEHSRKRVCLELRERAMDRAQRICPWVLDYQPELPKERTVFANDSPWTPMQPTPVVKRTQSIRTTPRGMVLDDDMDRAESPLEAEKAANADLECQPAEQGGSNGSISFTPREGVPERLAYDLEAVQENFANSYGLAGAERVSLGQMSFTPREGVPERLNVGEMIDRTSEAILSSGCKESGNVTPMEANPMEELDFMEGMFRDFKGVEPPGNIIYAAGRESQAKATEVADSFGNVDFLLASNATFDFDRAQEYASELSIGVNISSQAVETGQLPDCSFQNESVAWSQIKSSRPIANTPTQAPSVVPSPDTECGRQAHLSGGPKGYNYEVSSLGSWGITVRGDKCATTSTEDRSSKASQLNRGTGPKPLHWEPPRAPTPFNHTPATPSQELYGTPEAYGSPESLVDLVTDPTLSEAGTHPSTGQCQEKAVSENVRQIQSSITIPESGTPIGYISTTAPQGCGSHQLFQESGGPATSGKLPRFSSSSPLEDMSNQLWKEDIVARSKETSPTLFGKEISAQEVEEAHFEEAELTCDASKAGSEADLNDPGQGQEIRPANEEHAGELISKSTQVTPTVRAKPSRACKKPGKQERVKKQHRPRERTSLCGSSVGRAWVEEKGKKVRRSQREPHRPLRFWEGEKALYGRQYTSLSTVVGYEAWTPEPSKTMVPTDKALHKVDGKKRI